jgi:hypothetical protein
MQLLSGKQDTESLYSFRKRSGGLSFRGHYADLRSGNTDTPWSPHLYWYSRTNLPYKTGELRLCVLCLTLAT